MKILRILAPVTLAALVFAACTSMPQPQSLDGTVTEASVTGGRGIDPANMDTTCDACRDFYRHANGGWIDRNPVPEDRSEWSGYAEASQRTTDLLRTILEDAQRQAQAGADGAVGRLGTFYATCMDSARADAEGIAPIAADLARIAALRTPDELTAEFARLARAGVWVPFYLDATPDEVQSTQNVALLRPAGIVLGERGYYLREDSASLALLGRYETHIGRMFRLAGDTPERAAEGARQVLRMETAFARATLSREAAREPRAVYHPMPLDEARALAPRLDLGGYLAAVGAPPVASLNVGQPEFVREVGRLMEQASMDEWRALLRWRVLNDASPYLGGELSQAGWSFFASLSGTRQRSPLWRRCIGRTNDALGPELGRIYAARAFTPAARARAQEMVANLRASMMERIQGLTWMGEATREQALAKARALDVRLGYPDTIPDFSALRMEDGPFLRNMRAAGAWDLDRRLAAIGRPVDPGEWQGLPQATSGWYIDSFHQLTYPAGKFQPQFWDPLADDAVNYGALGSTISHEIVHGFDDQGRQYDASGSLRDWWTAEDDTRFRALADGLVRQYGEYVAADTVRVNGRLTLGENIADLGGVTVSYHAFMRSQRGKPRVIIDGLTPEQRFFISWAQNWRANMREEALLQQARTDPHSPMRYRLIGTVSNLSEFAAAFGCKAGDPMVRPDSLRVRIW